MNQEVAAVISYFKTENESLKQELGIVTERLVVEKNESSQKIDLLEERIRSLLQKIYGRKSENFENPDQTDLLDLLEDWEAQNKETTPEASPADFQEITYQRKTPKPKGPKPLPENLPRIQVYIDPPEGERICACCNEEMERVGEVITEELDIIPLQFRVKQYIQGKWCCKKHMNKNVVKPLPPRPIPKGRPSPSLLAYILIAKYCDALPLYRIEKIFKRHGIEIPRSTIDSWLGPLSDLLLPLAESLKRSLLQKHFLQMDETRIQALDPAIKKGSKRCYVWTLGHPSDGVYYFVSESRSGKHALKALEGFSGHLQTDGYAGYNSVYNSLEVSHIACMAHIRRGLFEAKNSHPERVGEILLLIQDLYKIERKAKEDSLTFDQRYEVRQSKAKPIFKELKTKLDELAPIPTPKSNLGKTVKYALNMWNSMARYLEVGEAEIDNNSCERDIKTIVIGRKNYLFLGRAKAGGQRVEAFYTLIESAKRVGLEPFNYLREVIERMPSTSTDQIENLLPMNFKENKAEPENAHA